MTSSCPLRGIPQLSFSVTKSYRLPRHLDQSHRGCWISSCFFPLPSRFWNSETLWAQCAMLYKDFCKLYEEKNIRDSLILIQMLWWKSITPVDAKVRSRLITNNARKETRLSCLTAVSRKQNRVHWSSIGSQAWRKETGATWHLPGWAKSGSSGVSCVVSHFHWVFQQSWLIKTTRPSQGARKDVSDAQHSKRAWELSLTSITSSSRPGSLSTV